VAPDPDEDLDEPLLREALLFEALLRELDFDEDLEEELLFLVAVLGIMNVFLGEL
jgi:hypothetical protein